MDPDRFDTLAKRLVTPTTRRATLGTAAAGGLLSALGLGRAVPEVRAAQRGSCVLAFVATVRQGPSVGQVLTPSGTKPGELRGELSFSLSGTGNLEDGTLTLADGITLPVVGQATGHALQVRIDLGQRLALVAVGVGEQEVAKCRGAIDGVAAGPAVGDLGDWHAAVLRQGGGGQADADSSAQGGRGSSGGGSGSTGRGSGGAGSDARATPRPEQGKMCPDGQTQCGDNCVDTATDPTNCSACGIACSAGDVCNDSLCVPANGGGGCLTGRARCGTSCADLMTDPKNCGACGTACSAGDACTAGACGPATTACVDSGQSCATAECCVGYCDQDDICECVPEGSECAQTGTGGCCSGQPCNPDGFCGTCTLFGASCNADAECCSGGQYGAGLCCSGVCTDVTNIGFVCPCAPSGQPCTSIDCCVGFCNQDDVCECVSDGGECAGIGTGGCCSGQPCNDSGFCGTCTLFGGACDTDAECCSGGQYGAGLCCFDGVSLTTRCTNVTNIGFVCPGEPLGPVTCAAGLTDCGGECVDLSIHAGNCGACGVSCGLGGVCTGGVCGGVQCPAGEALCGGLCTNIYFNNDNCGDCGIVCPAGLTCCNGACVDTMTDVNNCGGCNACIIPVIGDVVCVDGQCECDQIACL